MSDRRMPTLGARERAWLHDRLLDRIPQRFPSLPPSWLPHLAAWFVARADWCLIWVYANPAQGTSGGGRWRIHWDWIAIQMREASAYAAGERRAEKHAKLRAWRLQYDARRFPTLDAWLEAERAGRLRDCGARGGTLPLDLQRLLRDRAHRRRRTWSVACRVCGDTFRPRPLNARRCPACRAAGRISRPRPAAPGNTRGNTSERV